MVGNRLSSGLCNYVLSAAALFGLYSATGCSSIPSSADKNLVEYRTHVKEGRIRDAHDSLVCSQIGTYSYSYVGSDNRTAVVVLGHEGLNNPDNSLESRVVAGEWRSQANHFANDPDLGGDVEWEWSVDGGRHTSSWFAIVGRNDTPQRILAAQQIWDNSNSDTSRVTLYNSTGGEEYSFNTDAVSRGELQSRFYRALRNAELRSHGVPYRVGRVVLRQTVGLVNQVPLVDLCYPDDALPFEVGERDNVGGLTGYFGEADSAVPFPLSTIGYLPRFVTRAPLYIIRRVCGDGLEQRKQNNTLTRGDCVAEVLLSIFEPLDRLVRHFFGIDQELYQLVTAWPRVGNEIPVDDQVETGVSVARRAALAALSLSGGGSGSGVSGVSNASEGGGIGGGETVSDGIGGN